MSRMRAVRCCQAAHTAIGVDLRTRHPLLRRRHRRHREACRLEARCRRGCQRWCLGRLVRRLRAVLLLVAPLLLQPPLHRPLALLLWRLRRVCRPRVTRLVVEEVPAARRPQSQARLWWRLRLAAVRPRSPRARRLRLRSSDPAPSSRRPRAPSPRPSILCLASTRSSQAAAVAAAHRSQTALLQRLLLLPLRGSRRCRGRAPCLGVPWGRRCWDRGRQCSASGCLSLAQYGTICTCMQRTLLDSTPHMQSTKHARLTKRAQR